jgi:hypothetical protein
VFRCCCCCCLCCCFACFVPVRCCCRSVVAVAVGWGGWAGGGWVGRTPSSWSPAWLATAVARMRCVVVFRVGARGRVCFLCCASVRLCWLLLAAVCCVVVAVCRCLRLRRVSCSARVCLCVSSLAPLFACACPLVLPLLLLAVAVSVVVVVVMVIILSSSGRRRHGYHVLAISITFISITVVVVVVVVVLVVRFVVPCCRCLSSRLCLGRRPSLPLSLVAAAVVVFVCRRVASSLPRPRRSSPVCRRRCPSSRGLVSGSLGCGLGSCSPAAAVVGVVVVVSAFAAACRSSLCRHCRCRRRCRLHYYRIVICH